MTLQLRVDKTMLKTYNQVMNKPFKPEPIIPILADVGISISDLKKNPSAAIAEARLRQVAVLNRNKPVAYIVSPEVWEHVNDILVDERLERQAQSELEDESEAGIEVDLDEYL